MNNEPVAWMLTLPDGTHDWILDGNGCEGYIPLYTHPVDAVNISQECVDKKQNNRHEPVAWIEEDGMVMFDVRWASQMQGKEPIPLYTHPAKPSICVGYWDNKTGAFHKNLTELQQKRVADGFLQAVYTKGMLPAKTLTDEEIELYKHLKWAIEAYRDCAGFENKQLTFHHVCEALDDIDQYQKGKENE